MLPPLSSRYQGLGLPEFELSPIIRQLNSDKYKDTISGVNETQDTYRVGENENGNTVDSVDISNTYSNTGISEPSRIELSTWIGGKA